MGEQCEILEYQPDMTPLRRQLGNIALSDDDPAGLRTMKTRDGFQGHRFAGTVRA